jgi:hypothetical protein
VGLPALTGELGTAYVPLLMITYVVAFYLLVRQPARQAPSRTMLPDLVAAVADTVLHAGPPRPPKPGSKAVRASALTPMLAPSLRWKTRDSRFS